jgi:hypothetical protein
MQFRFGTIRHRQRWWGPQRKLAHMSVLWGWCMVSFVYWTGQLDWAKYSKQRSILNDQRPKILLSFIPHDGLAAPREDNSSRAEMGILKRWVDTSNTGCEASQNYWGRCHITCVTKCGWLLSISLNTPPIQDKCQVDHASPRVTYCWSAPIKRNDFLLDRGSCFYKYSHSPR